jgi:hypothetical protein
MVYITWYNIFNCTQYNVCLFLYEESYFVISLLFLNEFCLLSRKTGKFNLQKYEKKN